MIKFYNSKTREIEPFREDRDKLVNMYVCGPTVYGPAHIGNARPAIVFDVVDRFLTASGYKVNYVRNITDIDDKIINASLERNVPISQITDTATISYHHDLEALHCLVPNAEPKATENMTSIVAMIYELINKDHAYQVDGGEVFFHVPSNPFPGLANHTAAEAGSRVEVDSRKKDPRDFVLWMPAKEGEPSWHSPWGWGRPGWHIECSAMIRSHFGRQTIDIHGGGQDLRFPHHEAECAQSHCAHDQPLANLWMHNGLLTVEGEKMSKSRGNIILLSELLERFPGESVRYLFLQTHYRSPMDFSEERLSSAHRSLDKLYQTLYRHDDLNYPEFPHPSDEFMNCMNHDLNTPGALTELHRMADELDREATGVLKAKFIASGKLLGLFNQTPHQWRTFGVDKDAVETLIADRQAARADKDYGRADMIRQQLLDMGITLADGVHGTEWRRI